MRPTQPDTILTPIIWWLLSGPLVFLGLTSCTSTPPEPPVPNIIYILADDLGYGEVGAYGQTKIETPNIDALARAGMLFTQHYSGAPVCAPARNALLTGQHLGHTFVRGNDEWADRGPVWDFFAMARDSTLEGQRPLDRFVAGENCCGQQDGPHFCFLGRPAHAM